MILPETVERGFALIVAAAIAGERCPQNTPHGPLQDRTIGALVAEGRVRSETYSKNYRVVTILTGEHAGKATAPHPGGGKPFRVNGRLVRGEYASLAQRSRGTGAPATLARVGKIAP